MWSLHYWLVWLRLVSFFVTLAALLGRFAFEIGVPWELFFAYPALMVTTWLLYRLPRRRAQRGTFVEYLLMWDAVPLGLPAPTSKRAWNVWHFRNHPAARQSFGERLAVVAIRLALVVGVAMVIVAVAAGVGGGTIRD